MPPVSAPKQLTLDEQLVEDLAGFELDPYGFVLYAFPWGVPGTPLEKMEGPYPWQREQLIRIGEALRAGDINRDEAIASVVQESTASGHGIGKSAQVSMVTAWAMATMPHTRAVITAGTDTQLRTKTQPEIAKWFRMMICEHWFEVTATKIAHKQHLNSWRADFIPWSERNPEAFAGLHNKGRRILVIVDEASQVADIIAQTIMGALTDSDTQILWLAYGNPTRNTGWFRESFGRMRHRWTNRQIDSREVPGTNKALFQQWVDDYGEDSDIVRVRVRGVFPRASSLQFIPNDIVQEARKRDVEPLFTDPLVLGVDVARFGDDQSVVVPRRGRDAKSRPWRRFRNLDTMALASEVAKIANEEHADAIFVDEGGLGAGVVDRLRQLSLPRGCQIYGINFGGKPDGGWVTSADAIKVKNKATEMAAMKKAWLPTGAIPDEQEIEDDICGREYGFDAENRIVLERKEDMKRRGLSSPDNSDALDLTFAYPVKQRTRIDIAQELGFATSRKEYDPYA
jgi:hypothetical protein